MSSLTCRDFLARTGAGAALLATGTLADAAFAPAALAVSPARRAVSARPIGIELYAVRNELRRDLPATLAAVKSYGYEVVEFFAPCLG